MSFILQIFYSVISGLLLSLAIPNELYLLGSPAVAFVAIIPLYIVFSNCKSYKNAFWLMFIQVFTTHMTSSFWLAFFKDFAVFTLGASALATAAIGGFCGLLIFIPFSKFNKTDSWKLETFSLYKPVYRQSFFRIIYFAAAYTVYEWVKSIGFLGYPWGTVSSSMFRFKWFIQLADITGTYGITFLTVLFNSILGELLCLFAICKKNDSGKKLFKDVVWTAGLFAVLFVCTMGYGAWQYNLTRTPVKQLTTVMVQINQDPWREGDLTESILVQEKMSEESIARLKEQDKKPELIVWSEGSLSGFFPGAKTYYEWSPTEKPFIDFVKDNNTPVLVGGGVAVNNEIIFHGEKINHKKLYNSALMFNSKGEYCGYYGKLHLVPFAESIPFIDNPIIKKIMMKLVHISSGWHKGENLTYFEIPCTVLDEKYNTYVQNINVTYPEAYKLPSVKIATPICFDDAFTDVMRPLSLNGAELFVNITDDSWSLKRSSEYQHFCIAAYRAIEYRTTLVRSTNAGYSVVVDPSGKILADMPLFTTQSMEYDVPVFQKVTTIYAALGNWVPYLFYVLIIGTMFMIIKHFRYESKTVICSRKFKNKKK